MTTDLIMRVNVRKQQQLHVVPITTHTHDRRKSTGKKEPKKIIEDEGKKRQESDKGQRKGNKRKDKRSEKRQDRKQGKEERKSSF